MALSTRELAEVEAANSSGRPVVVFVHGLWLLAGSWTAWRKAFEARGYATVAPGWPGDPATVQAAKADPSTFAKRSIPEIVAHHEELLGALHEKPALVGHSFGGLLVQILAGRGLAHATVCIDGAPFRGVLPLPLSALKVASVVISNPRNRGRAVGLTAEQFRYGFGNAVSEEESRQLYDAYSVPGTGMPLFSAATANVNPGTPAKVDATNPERGPLLFVSGDRDHTVPLAITRAAHKLQSKNTAAVTELTVVENRGHSLTIDSGWPDVADVALSFLGVHHPASSTTS
jgi:pimeloyl-ACP methyl ester carboxylesterase